MRRSPQTAIRNRTLVLATLLFAVLGTGTLGFRAVSNGASSWIDCLYMTVITLTTIGFSEVVDLAHSPAGRLFTMALAFSGIGLLTYLLTSVTSLVVDPDIRSTWRKKVMEKKIGRLQGHFIVGGYNPAAALIVRELLATGRDVVIVHTQPPPPVEEGDPALWLQGDPLEDETLEKAGIQKAAGLFAVTGNDHRNVVLCLSARQAKQDLRIVAASEDDQLAPKMRKAGANAVISARTIGAMRMASEMIRPAAVSFLDIMLREHQRTLRVEEVSIPDAWAGKTVADLPLTDLPQTLLLALRHREGWTFNPKPDLPIRPGETLVIMTTPEEQNALRNRLQ